MRALKHAAGKLKRAACSHTKWMAHLKQRAARNEYYIYRERATAWSVCAIACGFNVKHTRHPFSSNTHTHMVEGSPIYLHQTTKKNPAHTLRSSSLLSSRVAFNVVENDNHKSMRERRALICSSCERQARLNIINNTRASPNGGGPDATNGLASVWHQYTDYLM